MKNMMILFLLGGLFFMNPDVGKTAGKAFKIAAVGDTNIAYTIIDESSSEDTLLLIMGYGCTMDMWPTSMIDALKKHARLIFFDNRGMGYSSGGEKDFSIRLFAQDTNALLDVLGVERVSLVGWSMGTSIALQAALDRPGRIKSMTLISAFCGGEESIWPSDSAWAKVLDLSGTVDERVQRMMHNLFPEKFIDANPGLVNVFPEITEPVNDDMIARQGPTMKEWRGCYARLNELKVPVVLITGDKDIVIPMENADIIASQLENSKVRIIKDGGHGVLYQNPDAISMEIIALLK